MCACVGVHVLACTHRSTCKDRHRTQRT